MRDEDKIRSKKRRGERRRVEKSRVEKSRVIEVGDACTSYFRYNVHATDCNMFSTVVLTVPCNVLYKVILTSYKDNHLRFPEN